VAELGQRFLHQQAIGAGPMFGLQVFGGQIAGGVWKVHELIHCGFS